MQYLDFKSPMMADAAHHPEDYAATTLNTWDAIAQHADAVFADLMLLAHNLQCVDAAMAELVEAVDAMGRDTGPLQEDLVGEAFSLKASAYNLLFRVGSVRNDAARRSVAE